MHKRTLKPPFSLLLTVIRGRLCCYFYLIIIEVHVGVSYRISYSDDDSTVSSGV